MTRRRIAGIALVTLAEYVAVFIVLVSCRAPVTREPLPTAFPTSVHTIAGRIEVRLVPNLKVDTTKVWGVFYWGRRLIEIEANAPAWVQWHTLYHETCHVTMAASGLHNLMPPALQEAWCDADASSRMLDRFGMV
jgi:hypothetical protein